jgi:hypothetical protein
MSAGDDLLALGIEPVKSRKSASHGEAGYARKRLTPISPRMVHPHPRPLYRFHLPDNDTIWEPACGDGRMANVLAAAGYRVVASDIADWGYGATGCDFLADPREWQSNIPVPTCAAIVTNPPFGVASEFVERALNVTRPVKGKVAILQRHDFDAASGRHPLFQTTGGVKLVLHKRPYWYITPADMPPSPEAAKRAAIPVGADGKPASPRFNYSWYLWDWARDGAWRILFCKDPDTIADSESLL